MYSAVPYAQLFRFMPTKMYTLNNTAYTYHVVFSLVHLWEIKCCTDTL